MFSFTWKIFLKYVFCLAWFIIILSKKSNILQNCTRVFIIRLMKHIFWFLDRTIFNLQIKDASRKKYLGKICEWNRILLSNIWNFISLYYMTKKKVWETFFKIFYSYGSFFSNFRESSGDILKISSLQKEMINWEKLRDI